MSAQSSGPLSWQPCQYAGRCQRRPRASDRVVRCPPPAPCWPWRWPCSTFDATFGQREAVVQFRPQTPGAVRLKVRAACSHLPQATPEPLPTDHLAADLSSDVRYRVDNASDGDLARLQKCLQKYPSVVGIEFSSPDGS
jgi:hypothetical protein